MRLCWMVALGACGVAEPETVDPLAAPPPTASASTRAPIDWAGTKGWESMSVAAFDAQLAEVSLPVLLPDLPSLPNAVVTSGPGWYAASWNTGSYHLVVQGNHNVFTRELPEGVTAPTRAKPAITRVDGIAELTFTDMGAAYTLDVECEQPMTNPICTQDDTLMQVFSALRWVETPASKAR